MTDSPDGDGLLPGAAKVMSAWRKVADSIGSRSEGRDGKGGSAEWNPAGFTATTTASGEMSSKQRPTPAGAGVGRGSDVGDGGAIELATEEETSTLEVTLTEKIKRGIVGVVAGESEQRDKDNDSGNNNNNNNQVHYRIPQRWFIFGGFTLRFRKSLRTFRKP